MCTIAKEENKYIIEFVNYYKNLNFNKIIIFDNNNINGEKFDIILKNYINNKFIKIINYRGIKRPQIKALNECYKKYNHNFDWIAFYDVDEYLYIKNYKNINNFLSLHKFEKCQSIIINWKYFGDSNKLFYENNKK